MRLQTTTTVREKLLNFSYDKNPFKDDEGNLYREIVIPKRDSSGKRVGSRTLSVPSEKLAKLQKEVYRHYRRYGFFPASESAYAFRHKRSALQLARKVAASPYVLRLDLKSFFPSIRHGQFSMVSSASALKLRRPGGNRYDPQEIPGYLVDLLFQNVGGDYVLPTGGPVSPAVSNAAMMIPDSKIVKVLDQFDLRGGFSRRSPHDRYERIQVQFERTPINAVYGRYCDDLIIGSDSPRVMFLIPIIKEILRCHGYQLNRKKTRLFRPGDCKKVLGIQVNNGYPSADRKYRRRLRARIHNCMRDFARGKCGSGEYLVDGTPTPIPASEILGQLNYCLYLNPDDQPILTLKNQFVRGLSTPLENWDANLKQAF